MNTSIFILLGSNLGDRLENLVHARQQISRHIGPIITTSSLYKTSAWGNVQQPDFYNQVIEIHSVLGPAELLTHVLEIEKNAGRVRIEKWGPRILDIDILFYGDLSIADARLTIPHPEIANRKFTLLPLAEIAPHLIHPVYHKTIEQLLMECSDELEVEKL